MKGCPLGLRDTWSIAINAFPTQGEAGAISRRAEGQARTPRDRLGPLLKPEAEAVWKMVASNVIRSVHYIDGGQGPVGAVLLLEVGDRDEAEAQVERLPMVQHDLLSLEILPLSPFTGLATLFAEEAGPGT